MAIVLLTVVVPFGFLFSCGGEKKEMVDIDFDPETSYTLKETDVETYVSDSGRTRYKIITDTWLIFGKAKEPYWFFPDGVYLERFDTAFNTEASIKADTARYFERRKIWKLDGNVDISNFKGERFQTPQLFWDQNVEKIYSDSFIRVSKGDKINTGIGFSSNQDMSIYKIYNPGAVIPFDAQRRTLSGDSIPPDSIVAENKTEENDTIQ